MESASACITQTNEFPKGVEAACVSYSLILCTTLGTAHGFNDHFRSAELGINWGRSLSLACDCCRA